MDRAPPESGVRFATGIRRLGTLLLGLLVVSAAIRGGSASADDPSADPTRYRLERWQALMREGVELDEHQQLAAVNDFFNGARFASDPELWQVADYWATPEEFLVRDAGDCEDFAIAKYVTLKAMGVAPDKLRITYVKVATLQQAHMVLAYYADPAAEPLILDNLNGRIQAAGERRDLRPIYSFNADSLWLARSRHEQQLAGDPGQLQRWREMLARLDPDLRHTIATPAGLR